MADLPKIGPHSVFPGTREYYKMAIRNRPNEPWVDVFVAPVDSMEGATLVCSVHVAMLDARPEMFEELKKFTQELSLSVSKLMGLPNPVAIREIEYPPEGH